MIKTSSLHQNVRYYAQKRGRLSLGVAIFFGLVAYVLLSFNPPTAQAAVITWDGGGTDGTCGGVAGDGNKWSCAANWSGDVAPGTADVATFNATNVKNATINAAISVAGIDLQAGYTGIITQAATVTVTVGSSNWTQAAGTFTGGNSTIDINGTFTLSGGTFTSTSDILTVGRSTTSSETIFTVSGGTFTHNSGTVKLDPFAAWPCGVTFTVDVPTTLTLNNITIASSDGCNGVSSTVASATGDTLIAAGNFTHTDGILTGTWEVQGNLAIGTGADGGTATVTFTNSVARTYAYSSGGTGPHLRVNSTSTVSPATGTTDLSVDLFTLMAGTFTAPSGTLTVGRSTTSSETIFTVSGGTFTHNSGTVKLDPFAAWPCGVTFTVDVPTTLTLNNITIASSDGCNGVSSTVASATGDTLIAAGNFTHTDGILTGTWEVQGNLTIATTADGGSATLTFSGTSAQTYTDNGGNEPDGDITINKSAGTVTLASNADWNATGQNLTITAGTLDLAGFTLATNVFTIGASGTLALQGGETSTTPTINAGGTVKYNGLAASYTLKNWSYSNLEIAGGASTVHSLPANLTGLATVTVTSGTLSLAGYNLSAATLSNNATLRLQGNETLTLTNGNDTDSGTVAYVGRNIAETFTLKDFGSGTDYYNLSINDTNTNKATFSSGAGKTVAGALTVASGTYDGNGQTTAVTGLTTVSGGTYLASTASQTFNAGLTISGGIFTGSSGGVDVNGDLTISSGTLTAPTGSLTISGNWAQTGGIFTPGSNTVTFDKISGTQTLNTGGSSFNNVTHSGAGTLQLTSNSLTSNGALTNSAGTFDANGQTVTTAGLVTISSGTYLASTASQTFNAGLTISGGIFTGSSGGVDVNGDLTISSGTLTAPTGSLTISGTFDHSGGTFTHNLGTVTLDGVNQTLIGSSAFNNLTKTVTSAATLTFPAAGTQTIVGTLTLKGTAAQLLSLRSSTTGSQWQLDPQGTRDLQYLDVQGSNNLNSTRITTLNLNIADSGNNTGWAFEPEAPANLTGTALTSTSIKWSWADNSTTETGFKLKDSAGTTIATISTANTTTYTETGLTRGTSYARKVVAYNNSGDSTATATVPVTTLATAPTTPTLTSPTNNSYLNTLTPILTFTRSTDDDDGLSSYLIIFDAITANQKTLNLDDVPTGQTKTLTDATATGTASSIAVALTNSSYLTEARHTWHVQAHDSAGNTKASDILAFTLDITKPLVSSVTVSSSSSSTDADLATISTNPIFTISLTDGVGLSKLTAVLTKRILLLGVEVSTSEVYQTTVNLSGTSASTTVTPSPALEPGSYRLTLTTQDLAGNQATVTRILAVLNTAQESESSIGEENPTTTPTTLVTRSTPIKKVVEIIEPDQTLIKTPPAPQLDNLEKPAKVKVIKEKWLESLGRTLDNVSVTFKTKIFGFIQDQLTYLQDLVQQNNERFQNQDQATAITLAKLNKGLTRLTGYLIIGYQQAMAKLRPILIAARSNRLELAKQTAGYVNVVQEPVVVTSKRLGLIVRYSFEVLNGRQDQFFAISDVAVEDIEPTTTVVTWQTSRLARTKINYGPTTSFGQDVFDDQYTTSHRILLTNLEPNTKYYFEILAFDLVNNQTYDAYYSFVTAL